MKFKIFHTLLAFFCFGMCVFAQSGYTDPLTTPFTDNEIKTAPTFNSCSYYYLPSGNAVFRT